MTQISNIIRMISVTLRRTALARIVALMVGLSLFFVTNVFAANHHINFTVGYKTVYFAGKARQAIAVNNQIPAPTLHFKEGDHVTINVYNQLDQETAIHWHGIILPWQMDGVLGVTQRGIQPGQQFRYDFTVHQSGTYWYHAHAGLQEQRGLYGALLIDPIKQPLYQFDKDYVIVLSDWSNTKPDKILSNLKKDGDYYTQRFPLQPSLAKFIYDYRKASRSERNNIIDDYKMMQQMRMSIYDLSDVAYDAFLLNGQPNSSPWTATVNIGDTVRLRFIGAGASTIFQVKIPGSTMRIVQVEGNDVQPYVVNDFTVAPGETYDVLVSIQKNNPYIIYAESKDSLGAAYGALVTQPNQFVDYKQVTPFSEPLPVTREMMSMMMGDMVHAPLIRNIHASKSPSGKQTMEEMMKMDPNMNMDAAPSTQVMPKNIKTIPASHKMSGMEMSGNMKANNTMSMSHMNMVMATESTITGDKFNAPDSSYSTSAGTKYQHLTAAVKTNDPSKPVAEVINMELFGYMGRYIWFINGIPEHKAKPIILNPAKRYRFVFTNTSMMHHPMHIHGHWFILRKGNGAYDPLLHTIDVAPGATITADLDTDASGQWLFHCHMLYHMMSGMARVFQYSTLIEIINAEAKPQDVAINTDYHNRPIVRIDEVRPIDKHLVHHPMAHHTGLWLATFLDVSADPFNNVRRVTYKGLYGSDYNKLELFSNDAEMRKGKIENADIDIFYWHLLDQFWAVKGGLNYYYRPANTPYWQPGIGIEGLMPYFIDTSVRGYYHSGSAKLDIDLSRDTQITNNFLVRLGVRSTLASKTVAQAQIGSGLNQMRYIIRPYYRFMPGLSVFVEYEHEQDYGIFKKQQKNAGELTIQNTWSLGLSLLF
jgi:CopA family copper-resistance protein